MRSGWRFWWMLGAICAALIAPIASSAQEYPTKPIEVVVAYPPGGGTDMTARAVADVARKYVGQPLVVLNKPGATGTIGTQYVVSSKADGYTLLVAGGSETVSLPHFKSLPYNPVDDFEPIIRITVERFGFYVKSDAPWKSMHDFVADAKKNPEKFSYATSGIGGIHHAAVMVLEKRTGIRLNHVPNKGGAETLAAVAGGHVDVAMAAPNEAYALVQGGRVRALALVSGNRSATEPNTPTLKELGYDVVIENQKGFVFPKGTPKAVVQKLHDGLRNVFDDPQFKANADKLKLELAYLGPEDFRKALRAMYDQIGESVRK